MSESPSKAPEEKDSSAQDVGQVIMERKGRIEDLDRSFDIEFWQRQGTAAIFAAAWELVKLYHSDRGVNVDELPFQRTVESFQRLPR
jgi:hypothetical protein